jgi:hypothetical protein
LLNKIGLGSYNLKPNIKTFIYNAYGRSILTYGFENVYFNKKLIRELRAYESITLKRILYVPKHCSTTKLFRALGITPIDQLIKKRKLNFLLRLNNNNRTKKVLMDQVTNISELHKQSLIKEILDNYITPPIANITNLDELINITLDELKNLRKGDNDTDEEEIENIKYLLSNRSKANNVALINLLYNGG